MGNKEYVRILCFVFGLILRCVWTYRTGAPTRACGDMTPQHGSPINTDPAPFLVEVSKTQYAPNERIYVRIRGCGLAKFKGFIIQPRSAVYPSRPAFLGAFLRVRGTRYECVRSGAVLTHSSPEEKDSVTLTWIAPPGPAGHVVFRVTFVQSYTNYWVGINSPVIYDGVSRDLTIMQAFSLQSATDQSCLPTRRTTTTSTTTTARTTTRRPTTPVPTTYLPTMPTEPYFTTTTQPPTTTTRRPTTTTTRRTTTRKATTTTTTLPPPPPTTRRRTTTTTQRPTTTTTTGTYYYDYYWETSTVKQEETTTNAQPTTTATTTQATTTATTREPIITMKFYYEPTTTTILPTKPTEAATTMPTTTTTTLPTTTTTLRTTTTTLPPTTTKTTTTTTTTLPPTTTTTFASIASSETTTLFPMVAEIFTTTSAAPDTTKRTVQQFLPTTYPTTMNMPTTRRQLPVTNRQLPVTDSEMPVTDRQTVTNWQIPVTNEQMSATNKQLPVTNRQIPVTVKEIPTTDRNFQNENLVISSAATKTPFIKNITNSYKPASQSVSTTVYPNTRTDTYMPRTTDYYDYDLGKSGNKNIQTNQKYVPTDRGYVPTDQGYIPTDRPYVPTDKRYIPTDGPYVPTEIIRNQSKYAPTTYKQYVPTTRSQKIIPTTNKPVYPTTSRLIYPPVTSSRYNPTSKQDAYLTFPPQTYSPEQPKETTTEYVSPKTTVNVARTRTPTTKVVLSTKAPAAATLIADQECGVTQGCFDDCRNGICNFIVSWKPERNTTKFEIRTKPMISGQYWAAVGLSNDKMMGLDSVTECITEGEMIQVYQSYNLDYYRNMRLLSPKLGIVNEFGSINDGIFSCSFTRRNFVDGEKDVFDLNKDWHMMFAEGPAVNGIKIPHRYDVVPPVTSERMDLQRYPPMHETYDYRSARKENIIKVTEIKEPALVSIQQRRLTMDQDCGSTKSCFQDCDNEGCRFIVTWEGATDHVMFTVRAVLNESLNQWIAIALSEDDRMGEDSVIQCVSNEEGAIDIRHSYNDDKNNIRVEQAELGLRNTSARFVDGIFECSFVRDRYVDNERIFDLDRNWNIHFAYGKSKKGIMLPHTLAEKPHVSDNAVDFSRSAFRPDFLAITASTFFIKIHAALMIFAWILCASVASVIGRYFQPYWWGEKMFGSKTWVKVHWLFVLITCAAVIAGFAVIFVGVGGISKLFEHPTYTFNGTHPIMGLVVSLLALLNPLLLCLRPSEDSSSRAFFNCLYWLVEIGAHVLAVVTVYAGFGLASFLVPSFFTFLIIGFTVYQILVLLFMEALKSYDAKKTIERKKIYLYEMQIRPWNARKNNSLAAYMDLNHTSKGLKNSVLATHLLLLSALSTTMIVLIIINDRFP